MRRKSKLKLSKKLRHRSRCLVIRYYSQSSPQSSRIMLTIHEVLVMVGQGMDYVVFKTSLPGAAWPWLGKQDLKFETTKGHGEAYVRRILRLTPRVINIGSGPIPTISEKLTQLEDYKTYLAKRR